MPSPITIGFDGSDRDRRKVHATKGAPFAAPLAAPRDGRAAQSMLRLRNGVRVSIREMRADDAPALRSFLAGMGDRSRWFRFFSGAVDLERMGQYLSTAGNDRFALIALDGDRRVQGHAVYFETEPGRAEIGLEVADELHGQGLGTLLVERLSQHAERHGIDRFVAEVLPENRAMLDVLRDGFAAHVGWAGGVNCVEFPTSAWRQASLLHPQAVSPTADGSGGDRRGTAAGV